MAHYRQSHNGVKINKITKEYKKIMMADLEYEESMTREHKLKVREKTRKRRPPII